MLSATTRPVAPVAEIAWDVPGVVEVMLTPLRLTVPEAAEIELPLDVRVLLSSDTVPPVVTLTLLPFAGPPGEPAGMFVVSTVMALP